MAWQSERLNIAPEAGGLLDQDYGLIIRMVVMGNIHQTVARLKSLTGDKIHSLTSGERRLIRYLLDEGVEVF